MRKPYFAGAFAAWTLALVIEQSLCPSIGFSQPIDPVLGPVVRIVSPANHAVFYAPLDIPMFAFVRPDGLDGAIVTNVEFFAGTNDLGSGVRLGVIDPLRPVYAGLYLDRIEPRLGSLYCLVWTNPPVGDYSLTAVASGRSPIVAGGISRTSPPVSITVLSAPTNTNPTDVVSIVATDPIAIAGTNVSWTWPGMTNPIPGWAAWPPIRWELYTNWGPKAALFTVRRFGDASDAITVNYHIGGTASNGVDYAMLPGYVNIPAGGCYALIPIVPIDSGISNLAKTVILTLQPSTNTPPDYEVGIPSHAAAVIFYKWPRPLPWLLPDHCFHLNAAGPDGAWFGIETSSDLLNWSGISTNQAFEGSMDFVDPDAPLNPTRYYRAVPLLSAPPP
jgi:hypothetical protein